MNDLTPRLDLRQTQTLVMTPQLQQAIKLLQLSNMELDAFVEEELAHNPLLERDDRRTNEGAVGDMGGRESETAGTEEVSGKQDEDFGGKDDIDAAFEAGDDFDAGSAMADIGSGGSRSFEQEDYRFEDHMSRPETLRDHLTRQLNMSFDDAVDRLIGSQLIDRLDESGYLREDLNGLASRLGCTEERLESILAVMRQLDPVGVFAKDLPDCLALQLEERGQLDEAMAALLDNLDKLAEHDYAALATICGVNEADIQEMVKAVRALNPKPAGDFDHIVAQTVVPDVLMKRLPKEVGGGWRVELNPDTLPRVLINQEYYTEVAGRAKSKDDKKYLNDKMQAASWLVRALDQRAQTITKVAGEIVEQQNGFFLYGVEFLRPMTLKDIADEIGMHESTVSRVTTNKYIGTPRGLFELKYFFTSSVGAGDDATSSEAVRAKIKAMIDEEDFKKVLSDSQIVKKLQDEGIDIARRTVAKYREELQIPSSVLRRKQKKNLAGR